METSSIVDDAMGLYHSKKFEMQNSIPQSMSVLLQAPENFRLKNCRTFKRELHTKSQIPNENRKDKDVDRKTFKKWQHLGIKL